MDKNQIKEILDIIQEKLDKKQSPLIVGKDISEAVVSLMQKLDLLVVNSSRTTDYLDLIRWAVYDELPNI